MAYDSAASNVRNRLDQGKEPSESDLYEVRRAAGRGYRPAQQLLKEIDQRTSGRSGGGLFGW